MAFDQLMIIRALRLSLTCIILFFLTWYYQVPESAWCLITVWFVMYEYTTIGGVFTKGLYRFTGTFLSAFYAMVIIYFCQNNIVVNVLALTPAVLLYSYYFMNGEKTYIAIIGSVTLTIVLLNYNRIDLAILRTFNIMLGVAGSMFMIRFFYPQYARDELIKTQAQFIQLLSQMITNYLDISLSLVTIKEKHKQYERNITTNFTNFHRLIREAKIETPKTPLYVTYNNEAFEHIGHIFHLTSVLTNYLTTDKTRSDPHIIAHARILLAELQSIHNKLENSFFEPPKSISATLSLTDAKKLPASHDQNTKFVKTIFNNIQEEIALLNEDISNIVLLYENYKTGTYKLSNGLR